MKHREKFIRALERKPVPGRVPHFELVFYLTMEVFGAVHPSHRYYSQWDQMSRREQQLHRQDMADIYIRTAKQYEHSAIFIHPNPNTLEEVQRLIGIIREKTQDEYFIMMHGDATFSIPSGDNLTDFTYRMVDEPEQLKQEARERVEQKLRDAEELQGAGLDGFALCSDYCFNTGPFLSPERFDEFVTPYLTDLIKGQKELGYYVIKHTDGNIMPIIDRLVDAGPHALHSLDPQGDVDIAEVKKEYGDRICLIGNVNCAAMDSGDEQKIRDSAEYALQNGMPGGGYIFSTSNCIYTGMDINAYETMLDVWREQGNYPEKSDD